MKLGSAVLEQKERRIAKKLWICGRQVGRNVLNTAAACRSGGCLLSNTSAPSLLSSNT